MPEADFHLAVDLIELVPLLEAAMHNTERSDAEFKLDKACRDAAKLLVDQQDHWRVIPGVGTVVTLVRFKGESKRDRVLAYLDDNAESLMKLTHRPSMAASLIVEKVEGVSETYAYNIFNEWSKREWRRARGL